MVDRQWARWQRQHPDQLPYLAPGQGPVGHRTNDPITILGRPSRTPAQLIDHAALGYTYDDDPVIGGTIVDLTVGAQPLAAGIGAAGEVDLYRFVAATAGQYVVETSGATDVVMTLLGPNDPAAVVTEDDDSGQGPQCPHRQHAVRGHLLRPAAALQPHRHRVLCDLGAGCAAGATAGDPGQRGIGGGQHRCRQRE